MQVYVNSLLLQLTQGYFNCSAEIYWRRSEVRLPTWSGIWNGILFAGGGFHCNSLEGEALLFISFYYVFSF